MKGKQVSIPVGMVFLKYRCSKCSARLGRERTYRLVTPLDHDYYQFHEVGTFPQRNYDVYSYRFRCPSCNARIAYQEQGIIKRIQKKLGRAQLTPAEIREHYKACKKAEDKNDLVISLLVPLVLLLVFFGCFYFFRTHRTGKDLLGVALLFLIMSAMVVVGVIRRHKGDYKSKFKRTYSYEKESQLNRLHAYSSHNRELVARSRKCYCFYCQSVSEAEQVTRYFEDEQTALCPNCGIDSILPDGIDEPLDESIISQMHDYWF